jgi:hypothetical protein
MMIASTYNLYLVFIALCFYKCFPPRGETTSRDTGMINWLSAIMGALLCLILRQMMYSGQIVESIQFSSPLINGGEGAIFYILTVLFAVIAGIDIKLYIEQRWGK